ncbi:hypothetical protein C8J56DRAFT_891253 [Mycena floridula]|nr:hypothetical protein C8J56DRAFT_891253 [Mycena floridula]
MPKAAGNKSAAAKQREAKKKGLEPAPTACQLEEERQDPSYVPTDLQEESSSDSDVDFSMDDMDSNVEWSDNESIMAQETSDDSSSEESQAEEVVTPMGARKRRSSNVDLQPAAERPPVKSRMTEWREKTGKTKKGRAKVMQPGIGSIFSVVKKPSIATVREEQGESDSDIEFTIWQIIEPITTNIIEPASLMQEASFSVLEMDIDMQESAAPVMPQVSADIPDIPDRERPQSAQPDSIPVLGRDDKASAASLDETKLKLAHSELRSQIKKQKKLFRKKKTVQTESKVFESIVNLEALDMYNDEYLRISLRKVSVTHQLALASSSTRKALLKKLGTVSSPATTASETVAARSCKTKHYARRLREMALHMQRTGLLLQTDQGKGGKHESFLTIPGVHSALEIWVKGDLPFEEGGFNGRMRPAKMRRYVNDFLFPKLNIVGKICESSAIRWLKKLGFRLSRVQKGVYVDGHERKDVVKARDALINYLETQVLPFCYEYVETDCSKEVPPDLPPGGKIHYPIFHDETCVHANDQANFVWMRKGEQPLRDKSRGRIVHVSDFILEHCGRLSLSAEERALQEKLPVAPAPPLSANSIPINPPTPAETTTTVPKRARKKKQVDKPVPSTMESRSYTEHDEDWVPPPPPAPYSAYRLNSYDARHIIYPGANYDPWWDMPQLIAQVKDAIKIFNVKYPDGVAVFIFDCSSAHEAFASDALLAHKMNRGSGGKQPKMRDTVIPSTNLLQSMVFPANYTGTDKDGSSLASKPKGMEQVLRERGLLAALEAKHKKVLGVCAKCKMTQAAREKAMKEAKARQDEIEGSGVEGMATRGISEMDEDDEDRSSDCCMQHFRERTDGTFPTAKTLVPECLDSVTTAHIRKFFRHCWRYMDAYKKGLNLKQAAYAVKKYTSHRRIPPKIMMDINILNRGATG